MAVLLSIVTALCVGYCLWMCIRCGVPESLSATYYTLGSWGWVFQLVMFSVGIGLWVVWFGLSEANHLWMVFLSCASLLFVGAAPAFRLELDGKVHYTAAIIGGVCSVAWQIAEGLWDMVLWWMFLCGMLVLRMKQEYMWWIEVGLIGSLLCNLWRVG